MDHVLLFQQERTSLTKQESKIYALGLELDHNLLYLSVEWVKDKEGSRHLLHRFQDKSAQLQIFQSFFTKQENKMVHLEDATSGNNSTKFLERIGLVRELRSIFVEKASTYTVLFRGKRIELHSPSLPAIDQNQLIQQIETLAPKR